MATAHFSVFTGVSFELPEGSERTFGRADTVRAPAQQPASCSRQQFKLHCSSNGVEVTSLSAVNPTKVVPARGSTVLLQQGTSRRLQPGDRVLLLACDTSMFVKLDGIGGTLDGAGGSTGHATAGSQLAPGGPAINSADKESDGEPPNKRARVEEGTGAKEKQQQPNQRQQQEVNQQEQAAGSAAASQPVVLVLVGVQGSGKSTFCHSLMAKTQQQDGRATPAGQEQPQEAGTSQQQPGSQQAQRRWVRVNQDSIAGGKRGTREQCLEGAAAALARGDSVLIDRTNADQDQRRPFVRLAQQQGVEAHCLVLKLPLKLCKDRAAARTDHEGAVQGKTAYAAVASMHRKLVDSGDPQQREGFASVLICENDAEVAAALEAWSRYGPDHPDPAAEYARLKPPPPKLNTIDRFFKKQQQPAQQQASDQQEHQAGSAGSQEGPSADVPSAPAGSRSGGAGLPEQARQVQDAQQQQQQQQQPKQQGQSQPSPAAPQSSSGTAAPGSKAPVDAFQAMRAASRQQQKAAKGAVVAGSASGAGAEAGSGGSQSRHTFGSGGPWAGSLVQIAADPESCRSEQPGLWYDDRCVWIQDKFPKAQQHWLLVARERRLGGPLDLTAADVRLVEHMLAVAGERVGALREAHPDLAPFRCGFHSVPSLRQLHMHVISQDFEAEGLKTKKHWNSFTSPFFLDAAWVLCALRQRGQLQHSVATKEALLKGELRCHRCGAALKDMPRLKEHIVGCQAPLKAQHLY